MRLVDLGFIIIIVGFFIIFAGVLLHILRGNKGKIEGGGIILIGPIPIVWGTGSKIVLALTIISIIILMIIATILMMGW